MRKLIYLAAVLLLSSLSSYATSTTAVPTGSFGGTQLATTGLQSDPSSDLTYTEFVYRDPNNQFCNTCLDFVITVTNPSQPSYIGTGLNTTGFGSYSVALAYANNGAVAPISATDTGGTVSFGYLLGPGSSTDPLIIYTNAMSYGSGGITFSALGLDPPAFAPTGTPYTGTVTPEPSTLTLLGTGMACLMGMARRRRR